MTKYALFLSFLLFSFIAKAHQPDISSTMLVEQEDGTWILQVRASLTAFEYEVNTHYGKDSYPTPEKFQELVISHLKENLSIHFNESVAAVFQNPYVKLGHETNAVFEVSGVPETWNSVSVKNSSFKDINRNQSALIILKKGFAKEQFVLNKANDHQVKLKASESKFVLLSDSGSSAIPWLLYGFIGVGIMGVLVFLWRRKGKIKTAH
ncbi:MAG: hypothetical protein AB8B69_24810 [Chitinophagales bacterium]